MGYRNFITGILVGLTLAGQSLAYGQGVGKDRLRVGVAGLSHGHVHWILGAASRGEVDIVGIAERDRALAERLMSQYKLSPSLLYADLDRMLSETKPEAVTAFGPIYDHLQVVKACAPRKIHVMVEKPLAVSLDHAREMQDLAIRNNIHLLTNYETTWYASNHEAYRIIHTDKKLGDIRKIVVHDGHQGPKEIGVNEEFLAWLTDPKLNGAGALMDFGCYGADLATWLMRGERPTSVLAVTQQLKPDVYPDVDDEATIILTYPRAQAIIQASWNWPYNRKDMEIYGVSGYVTADKEGLRLMTDPRQPAKEIKTGPRDSPYHDPFAFFTAVIRGRADINDHDLSSLPVNMIAMEILDAAKRSAAEGRVIHLTRDK